jgi:hypothetical protein
LTWLCMYQVSISVHATILTKQAAGLDLI